jgi:hypothetical protein
MSEGALKKKEGKEELPSILKTSPTDLMRTAEELKKHGLEKEMNEFLKSPQVKKWLEIEKELGWRTGGTVLSKEPMFGSVIVHQQPNGTLKGRGSWEGEEKVRVHIGYGKDPDDPFKPVEKGVIHAILYREAEYDLETIFHVTFRRKGLLKHWKFDTLVESEVEKSMRTDEWEKNLGGLLKNKEAKNWLRLIEDYYKKIGEFKKMKQD